ncbi:DUF3618 domain-containing protein [Leifsonia sp. NPDC058248]|uniref:DUF3618 domain-containing protein n=1 Tax=Leifsonia sp. NPDC058248 TaxID=3346402 RepID=UPI0036DB7298
MTTEPTGTADLGRLRAELAETIDAIEYKLNVPKRVTERVQRLRHDNPLALVGIAVGVAAAIGGVVWMAVRAGSK